MSFLDGLNPAQLKAVQACIDLSDRLKARFGIMLPEPDYGAELKKLMTSMEQAVQALKAGRKKTARNKKK